MSRIVDRETHRARSSRAAFTLMELLSVIGVVLILVAMLLPGIRKARQMAGNAKCVSNLRATGQAAIQLFNDQNGEFLQSPFWYWYDSASLPKGMIDYLNIQDPNKKVDTVLTCPAIKAQCAEMFPLESNRCFSVNTFIHAKDPNLFYIGGWEQGLDYANTFRRMSNVEKPGKLLLFTDGGRPSDPAARYFATMVSDSSLLLFPHGGKQNAVFLDGHVETLTKQQFDHPESVRDFWGDLR